MSDEEECMDTDNLISVSVETPEYEMIDPLEIKAKNEFTILGIILIVLIGFFEIKEKN